ncbi:hypothetical protein QNH20_01095 [Neobacillus sp. WH10]|uniref:hypothetical protein n=1 Tax=Neobacillus sp. WH10 TaxID=3047873 RepID=UPI0024C1DD21|nr:hypothetical protein [Neobacillus sp. WH10]WHY77807.1 hypothetical protein QNH20_01095 [Neobacillus sp. WH10]
MFEKLKETVEKFDLLNLLITNSACQMMPVNANKLQRFEAVAFCLCSCLYEDNKLVMSKSRIKSIYNSNLYDLEKVAVYEDPFEQMFTESITFYGGTYIVFPGITETGTLIIRQLLKAIFLSERKSEFGEFYKEAYDVAILFLSISNAMAEKAGLNYREESKVKNADITIPPFDIEERLFDAVSFDKEELAEILSKNGVDIGVLDDFIVNFGDANIHDYTSDNHFLHHKPFLRYGDEIIVTMPCNLLGTLRHSIISLANEFGFSNELNFKFQETLWNTTIRCLSMMNIETKTQSQFVLEKSVPEYREGLFSIDSDKVMYVQLHTDNFADYDANVVYGMKEMLKGEFEKRALELKSHILEEHKGIKTVFFLLLLQPAGRAMGLGINQLADEIHLMMSLNDLEVVSLMEGGDPLLLYKFAKAKKRVESKIYSLGFLDTYSLYKFNDKSFYFSDEEQPTMYYFSVGEGREVIEEMHRMVRPHGVPVPNGKKIIEVVSMHSDETIPIYLPASLIKNRIMLLVEGDTWNIWVTSKQIHPIAFQMVDLVAYWIWQFSHELNQIIRHKGLIEIEINLDQLENWTLHNLETHDKELESDPISYRILSNVIQMNISNSFQRELEGHTNKGERVLVKKVLLALEELNKNRILPSLNKVIEDIAPIGVKKKLLVFNQNNVSVLLEPGNFPQLRYIDSADENMILDDIGEWLKNEKKIKVGKITNQKQVINEVVGYLFSKIEASIQNLKEPENLLQTMMLYYETLLYKREEHRITIPTTLHCFSDKASMVNKINDDTSKFNKPSVSLRFLIEYVSACPPRSGKEYFSMEVMDYLLALSSLLIEWANNSDLINYQLADLQISMLPSGRLGIAHENNYFSASSTYFRQYSSQVLSNAIDNYESNWRTNGDEKVETVDLDIVHAFEEEFGVGFYPFTNFITSVVDLGRDLPDEVKSMPYVEFVEAIQKTELSKKEVEDIFSLLSLRGRENFLKAPKGFRKEDMLPWKFNRELSYLRRPFILQNDMVYWSNRHLFYCGQHLIDLCVGGRLKAKSEKMKNLISKYQNIRGEKFNNIVEGLFSSYDFLITRGQVKKFGGKRIEGDKGDLGDIDVLVINPRTKSIFLLECKDLSIARNPYEIHHELNNLFVGTAKKPSIVQKHSKRTMWIKENIDLVLANFSLSTKGKWIVKPLIVIDEEMISPYLYKEKEGMRVISINKLKEELDSGKFFRK